MPILFDHNSVTGVSQYFDYDPTLAAQLDDQMAIALGGIVKKAQNYVPSSSPLGNWNYRRRSEFYFDAQGNRLRKFPLFNSATVSKEIKYSSTPRRTNKRGFKAVYYIINKSAAGAIYETAGRKNPSGQPWVGRKGDPRQAYNVKKQLANAGASTIPSLSAVGDSVLSVNFVCAVQMLPYVQSCHG